MIEKMLQALLGELQKISRAETVVGEAIHAGETTVIPICRVQIGFGAGTSGHGEHDEKKDKTSRAGTGGGIRVEPVACIVVDKTGRAQLLSLTSGANSTVGKVIDLLPEVLDRLGFEKKENAEPQETPPAKHAPKK